MSFSIRLETFIEAPCQTCFDLSRSIDVHLQSSVAHRERVIGGRRFGLMEQGEFVKWSAVHFGIRLQMTVTIIELRAPAYFCDVMIKGPFSFMKHEHVFHDVENGTLMIDVFHYGVPYGIMGRLFNHWFLRNHLAKFLRQRNAFIKKEAEALYYRPAD